MDPKDLPKIEPGDELDRALKRAQAEKRSDFFYLGGTALGAVIGIVGAGITVAGGPAWVMFAGFALGAAVGFVFAVIGRKQHDFDPSGEIEPAPPVESPGPGGPAESKPPEGGTSTPEAGA